MTVLLLDPRWPNQIPLEACQALSRPVRFTDEVPVSVRWDFDGVLRNDSSNAAGQEWDEDSVNGTLVSTNEDDPLVVKQIAAGARVIEAASRKDPVRHATEVMTRARTIGSWEIMQTHESLVPYLLEESNEFAQAVQEKSGDEALKAELSDVFLQVLFHAEIASRRGAFDMNDVAQAFVDKMKLRAPYLFDGTTDIVDAETQDELWARGKNSKPLS